jgi:hypothetical protein
VFRIEVRLGLRLGLGLGLGSLGFQLNLKSSTVMNDVSPELRYGLGLG